LIHSQPVTEVSFYDACKWCNAKSEMDGLEPVYRVFNPDYQGTRAVHASPSHKIYRSGVPQESLSDDFLDNNGYRLPTACEWEWAASSGIFSKIHTYNFSGSDDFSEVGWLTNTRNKPIYGVGEKKPNDLEIYDMSGLSNEWCWDEQNGQRMLRKGYSETGQFEFPLKHVEFQSPTTQAEGNGLRIVKNTQSSR
jgi:formylglycine-generating enzyme required for sulfatase activity